ncbi:MAG: hypothetical protein MK171_00305 [Pirellulales bacterium]|nr:hypothetical protein [Pirellulales bacterium]
MVTTTIPGTDTSSNLPPVIEIELREPWLAALLAWVLPGLGHIYQGRIGKGVLFFICVLGTFVYGMYLGGGKVVYAAVSWEQQYRWQYLCQLGVGLPSTPMLWQREKALTVHRRRIIQKNRGMDVEPEYKGFMAPPRSEPMRWKDDSGNWCRQPNELAMWVVKHHPNFELGTTYTVVAGLLNILVICDAAAGPLIISPGKEKDEENEQGKTK